MHSLMLYEITGPPKPASLSASNLPRRSRPAPLVSRPGLTQAARPEPAAAVAGRRQPGENQGKQAGGVGVTKRRGPSLPPPPPFRCPQARLPKAHPRRHRKHFLGLTDSALGQSPSRNSTLLH